MPTTATIRSYRDLTTWQKSRELCLVVYELTTTFPTSEQFGLTSQMRRSAVSIPSNIAEGFGRQTAKEKQQFYHHSLGSLFELETQADIASQLAYITITDAKNMNAIIDDCRRLLLALIKVNKTKFSNLKSPISNLKDD